MAAINDYFMIISFLGILFQMYIVILIWVDSETMYLPIENKSDSIISLLVSIFLYGIIFGLNFYFKHGTATKVENINKFHKRMQKQLAKKGEKIELTNL